MKTRVSLKYFTKYCRFIIKKWIDVHDQSGNGENRYKPTKQIRFKTWMLQSDSCDYSDAYVVVKGTINVVVLKETINVIDPNNDGYEKKLAFKNNAPFVVSCISKINNTLIDNAENLDITMHMYNLIEYRQDY